MLVPMNREINNPDVRISTEWYAESMRMYKSKIYLD
jgi:hypothetical protein